jgi:hypothetical protein
MLLHSIPALEPLDAASGIDQALLSSVERMALGTDFDVEFAHRRAGLKRVAAGAGNHAATVYGMDCGFHWFNSRGPISYLREYHPLRFHTIRRSSAFLQRNITTIAIAAIFAILAFSGPAGAAEARTPAAQSLPATAPGFAPDGETMFAPPIELASPGPSSARSLFIRSSTTR